MRGLLFSFLVNLHVDIVAPPEDALPISHIEQASNNGTRV